MQPEQYDRWFSDEQQQVTRDRKQRLLAAQKLQQQRGAPISASPRSATPQYIQRQLLPSGLSGQIGTGYGGLLSPSFSDGGRSSVTSAGADENGEAPTPAAMAPIFRSGLRGLRITEGTDAVLQCSVVGVPKPKAIIYYFEI